MVREVGTDVFSPTSEHKIINSRARHACLMTPHIKTRAFTGPY